MIGVVIASHGHLAEELLAAAQSVVGPLVRVKPVTISTREVCRPAEQLGRAIDELDDGEGVLVLCDLFGGSPSQAACQLLHDKRVEVVSGVNLPMVIKLASAREGASLQDLARLLTAYGQKNVVHASERVRELEARCSTGAEQPGKS